MGSASLGPLLVGGVEGVSADNQRSSVGLLDVRTLKALVPNKVESHVIGLTEGIPVRASADGKVFTSWKPGSSPQYMQALQLAGGEVKCYSLGYTSGALMPGPDGRTIYSTLNG